MEKKESWFMIILTGVGIAGFIYSLSLPLMGAAALSPGLFPGFVTALMTILSIVRFVQLMRLSRESGKSEETEEEGSRNIFVIIGLFLLYLLMLSFIHFLAATLIFLLVSMFFLYKKFYWKIPLISILTTAGIFSLFRYLLNVRLP